MNVFESTLLRQPLTNLSSVLDVPAAIDYWLGTEVTKNPDGYRGSIKMHKDTGGPLVMGPLWVRQGAVSSMQPHHDVDRRLWFCPPCQWWLPKNAQWVDVEAAVVALHLLLVKAMSCALTLCLGDQPVCSQILV